jgi:secondary thiamine-phosphate synthase enzyme
MKIVTDRFSINTVGHTDILDITSQVQEKVKLSSVEGGSVTVFVSGSTAGVTTVEYEQGLLQDLKRALEELAPESALYAHDAAWGDGNGYAHVRASLLGPSLSVPVVDGRLALGTWQQIVLVDFDNRSRRRQVLVQIVGE